MKRHTALVSVVVAIVSIAVASPASADAGKYSVIQKTPDQPDPSFAYSPYVDIRKAWAGHDGETAFVKVKVSDLITPDQVAKVSPKGEYRLQFSVATHEDEFGPVGFSMGDLIVDASSTRTEIAVENNGTPGCDVTIDLSRKRNTVTVAAPFVCEGQNFVGADGESIAIRVVSFAQESPDSSSNPADVVSLDNVR